MVEQLKQTLFSLYEEDETAWLERMADLAAHGRFEDMDFENLSEYLQSMAKRDKRAVYSRLVVLLTHLLKWDHQPERRTGSWQRTILLQRVRLRKLLESGSLRRYAEEELANAYRDARDVAAAETGLPTRQFPKESSRTLDQILTGELA